MKEKTVKKNGFLLTIEKRTIRGKSAEEEIVALTLDKERSKKFKLRQKVKVDKHDQVPNEAVGDIKKFITTYEKGYTSVSAIVDFGLWLGEHRVNPMSLRPTNGH